MGIIKAVDSLKEGVNIFCLILINFKHKNVNMLYLFTYLLILELKM